ncbi:MAG: DUF2225 domain-containing protein [candidate division Zixibacteria bacterium]|nr:DUF2225 domain-containing protein [candidate division Zixibacteria bacterium]
MTTESPFFLTKIECPICKTINEFETIKVGAYTERDRDTDFCPTDRIWRNSRYQAYNPLLFFTATCAHCFYTREFTAGFKEWKEDAYFKTYRLKSVKQKHLNLLAEADSIIRTIGEVLDSNRYPNETAILKLLLAIIDESLNDRRIDLDLGRFYLRIGWIFRDMNRGDNPGTAAVRNFVSGIQKQLETVRETLENLRLHTTELEAATSAQLNDANQSADMQSQLYPIKEKYDVELEGLRQLYDDIAERLESLRDVAREHQQTSLGVTDNGASPGFANHPSFRHFLSQLSSQWDGIPLDEKEALTWAVKYYVAAYKEGRDIGHGNQQIQASYLIAELSRRINDYDQAKEYFNNTIRTGQEFIYKHRRDQSRTALARKILELAIEQGRLNMTEAATV